MQKERYQSQINQNFGTICHTEVCLTFSRLAAKLSEMITKFRGRSLKIQHRSSFDLNSLKNGPKVLSSESCHGGHEIIRQKSVYDKSVKIRITLHNLFQPIASPSTNTLGSSVRKRSINNNNNLHSVTIHWKRSHRYSRTNQVGYTCKKPLKMEAKCEQDLFSMKIFQERI